MFVIECRLSIMLDKDVVIASIFFSYTRSTIIELLCIMLQRDIDRARQLHYFPRCNLRNSSYDAHLVAVDIILRRPIRVHLIPVVQLHAR